MLINSQTKIAALLKHHPEALETIVSLSPDFEKLRNPILRKLMAGRTTIGMAAKIGGCKPEDFFKKLKPLGFETDGSLAEDEINLVTQQLPQYIKDIKAENLISLDVREMLTGGTDPLKLIQQKVKELKSGQVLKIINTFEPTPLIKLLEKQGFSTFVDFVSENCVETYFYRSEQAEIPEPEIAVDESGDWDQILKRFENKLQEIDVRHLEMPMPMMTILEALEKLPVDKALYVHHKRIPVFLLTELRDRNFDYRIKAVSDGEVYLLIFRN